MSVPGDITTAIKIIQNPKLSGEDMLIRGYVFAVHGQTWISIAWLQIAKNLVVGTIFFDDVDHVANRIVAPGKGNWKFVFLHEIALLNLSSQACQVCFSLLNAHPSDGSVQQRNNVGVHRPPPGGPLGHEASIGAATDTF